MLIICAVLIEDKIIIFMDLMGLFNPYLSESVNSIEILFLFKFSQE